MACYVGTTVLVVLLVLCSGIGGHANHVRDSGARPTALPAHKPASAAGPGAGGGTAARAPVTVTAGGGTAARAPVTAMATAATTVTAATPEVNPPPMETLKWGWGNDGTVDEDAWVYYRLDVPPAAAGKQLWIALTSWEGQGVLYASATDTHPGSGATWSCVDYGDNTISISPDDPNRCSEPCTYYVSMHALTGVGQTEYDIVPEYGSGVEHLQLGMPEIYQVRGHTLGHLEYSAPWQLEGNLEVALYIISYSAYPVNMSVDVGTAAAAGQPHDYTVVYDGSPSLSITLRVSDPPVVHKCPERFANCTVFITVNPGAHFVEVKAWVAGPSSVVRLSSGEPIAMALSGTTKQFFSLGANAAHRPVVVTATGPPDAPVFPTLYGSCSTTHPGAYGSSWAATVKDPRTGVIQLFVPSSADCPTNPPTYYFSLEYYAAATAPNVTYTLVATEAPDAFPTELVSDSQQPVQLQAGETQYFQLFRAAQWETGNVEFQLASSQEGGTLVGYVTNQIDPTTGLVVLPTVTCNQEHCEPHNARWAVDGEGIALIRGTDPLFCSNCAYVLAVYADGGPASGFVTGIATAGETVRLSQAAYRGAEVLAGSTQYYQGFLWRYRDQHKWRVVVTRLYGHVDMLASSTTSRPSVENYVWSTSWDSNEFTVDLDTMPGCKESEAHGASCQFFVAVRAQPGHNASYYIRVLPANGVDQVIGLFDGSPQTLTTNSTNEATFVFGDRRGSGNQARIVAIAATAGRAIVRLYTNKTGPPHTVPTVVYPAASAHAILVPASAPRYCPNFFSCQVFVGVVADPTVNGGVVNFDFVVGQPEHSARVMPVLLEGHPLPYITEPGSFSYFQFDIADAASVCILSLTASAGQATLYAKKSNPDDRDDLPSPGDFGFAAFGETLVITMHPDDAPYCDSCTMIVAVQCHGGVEAASCEYLLTKNIQDSVTSLLDGRPVASSLSESGNRLFHFPAVLSGVRFSVKALYGSVVLYGTNDYHRASVLEPQAGHLPSSAPGRSYWSTLSIGVDSPRGVLELTPHSPHWSGRAPGSLPFTLAVTSSATAVFQVEAVANPGPNEATLLQLGVPSVGQIGTAYDMAYFQVNMPTANADLLLSATSRSGSVALLVSTTNPFPTCEQVAGHTQCQGFTWQSSEVTQSVSISHSRPCDSPGAHKCEPQDWRAGPVYIGVYALEAGSFDIVVSEGDSSLSLPDGVHVQTRTGLRQLCPERDPNTGACAGSPSDWTSAQAAGFDFTVAIDPTTGLPPSQFVLNRGCAAGYDCAAPLNVYVSACADDTCSVPAQHPSQFTTRLKSSLAAGTNVLPLTLTATEAPLCALDAGAQGLCNFYVLVEVAGITCPGDTCAAHLIEVMFTSVSGVEVVDSSCVAGRICVLPDALVADTPTGKRFEVSLGSNPETLYVGLHTCFGPPPIGYLCHDPAKCQAGIAKPSNTNFEFSVASDQPGGNGLSVPGASGNWYMAVFAPGGHTGTQAGATARFQLWLSSGVKLPSFDPPQLTVTIENTVATVEWEAPVLVINGQRVEIDPLFTVYAVPSILAGELGYELSTPCGLAAATSQTSGNRDFDSTTQLGDTQQLSFVFSLRPTETYTFNVVFECGTHCGDARSAGDAPLRYAYTAAQGTTGVALPTGGLSGATQDLIVIACLVAALGVMYFAARRCKNRYRRLSMDMGPGGMDAGLLRRMDAIDEDDDHDGSGHDSDRGMDYHRHTDTGPSPPSSRFHGSDHDDDHAHGVGGAGLGAGMQLRPLGAASGSSGAGGAAASTSAVPV